MLTVASPENESRQPESTVDAEAAVISGGRDSEAVETKVDVGARTDETETETDEVDPDEALGAVGGVPMKELKRRKELDVTVVVQVEPQAGDRVQPLAPPPNVPSRRKIHHKSSRRFPRGSDVTLTPLSASDDVDKDAAFAEVSL